MVVAVGCVPSTGVLLVLASVLCETVLIAWIPVEVELAGTDEVVTVSTLLVEVAVAVIVTVTVTMVLAPVCVALGAEPDRVVLVPSGDVEFALVGRVEFVPVGSVVFELVGTVELALVGRVGLAPLGTVVFVPSGRDVELLGVGVELEGAGGAIGTNGAPRARC